MMEYTINMNLGDNVTTDWQDITNKVQTGFSIVERLDEKLDTGLIIIPFDSREDEYPRFSQIEILINDTNKSYEFLLAGDLVELSSKSGSVYRHTFSLIENTKKLEKELSSVLTFTQPTDLETYRYSLYDVLERIRNTNPISKDENVLESERIFTISAGLKAELENIKSPQFFFKNLTVRESLNESLKYYNSVSRLNKSNELEIDKYNELKNIIDEISTAVDVSREENISQYGTTMRASLSNQISYDIDNKDLVVYPANGNYASMNSGSDQPIINTGNLLFEVIQPTYVPFKLEIKVYGVTGADNTTYTFDITDRLVEYQDFRKQELENDESIFSSVYADYTTKRQSNTLYYDYEGIQIKNLSQTYGTTDTVTALENIVLNEVSFADDGVYLTGSPTFTWTLDLDKAFFRFTYSPITDSRIDIERNDIDKIDKNSQIISNQNDRIIDFENFTNNLYGQVQRFGNEEVQISNRNFNTDTLFELGDYTEDVFVVSVRELFFFNDFIFSKYQLTKNFNRLDLFTAVNSEYRSWELLSDARAFDRIINQKKFIEISLGLGTERGSNDEEVLTNLGITSFFTTFSNTSSPAVTACGINTFNDNLQQIQDSGDSILNTCTSIGGTNTMAFTYGFNSNKIAGNRIIERNGKDVLEPVLYTEDNGEVTKLKVSYFSTLEDRLPVIETRRRFPLMYTDMMEDILFNTSAMVFKDSSEIEKGVFQLQFVPKKSFKDRIVIGRELGVKNGLVTENRKELFLYLYRNDVVYNQLENLTYKSNFDTKLGYGAETWFVEENNFRIVILIDNLDTYSSYAIADDDGNLYLAVNQLDSSGIIEIPVITFDFIEKRNNISYDW